MKSPYGEVSTFLEYRKEKGKDEMIRVLLNENEKLSTALQVVCSLRARRYGLVLS